MPPAAAGEHPGNDGRRTRPCPHGSREAEPPLALAQRARDALRPFCKRSARRPGGRKRPTRTSSSEGGAFWAWEGPGRDE